MLNEILTTTFIVVFGAMFVSVLAEGFYVGGLWLLAYFLTSFIAVVIQGIPLS